MASNNNPGSSRPIAGALTYPDTNEDDSQMQPVAEQPRQPRTLQGLLRFALDATMSEDAPGNSQRGQLDEEQRRFLNAALNAHTVHVNDILRKNIKILTDMEKISSLQTDDQLTEDLLLAFQELGEYIDDIDVANDFEKLGGFIMFPMCYSCDNIELHRWANMTLAQVCQNNPHCQEQALRCCLLPVLLHKAREQQYDDRSLKAISCMIRNYEAGMRSFVALGGCEVLLCKLQNADDSELTSAAFLVTYLCRNSSDAREIFIKDNIIEIIVERLKAGRTEASEYLLSTLVVLMEMHPADIVPVYREPALDLKTILENHLRIQDVRNGRFVEEKEHCESIIHVAFHDMLVNGKSDRDLDELERADR